MSCALRREGPSNSFGNVLPVTLVVFIEVLFPACRSTPGFRFPASA